MHFNNYSKISITILGKKEKEKKEKEKLVSYKMKQLIFGNHIPHSNYQAL
jgi:hypothetical protein